MLRQLILILFVTARLSSFHIALAEPPATQPAYATEMNLPYRVLQARWS